MEKYYKIDCCTIKNDRYSKKNKGNFNGIFIKYDNNWIEGIVKENNIKNIFVFGTYEKDKKMELYKLESSDEFLPVKIDVDLCSYDPTLKYIGNIYLKSYIGEYEYGKSNIDILELNIVNRKILLEQEINKCKEELDNDSKEFYTEIKNIYGFSNNLKNSKTLIKTNNGTNL